MIEPVRIEIEQEDIAMWRLYKYLDDNMGSLDIRLLLKLRVIVKMKKASINFGKQE